MARGCEIGRGPDVRRRSARRGGAAGGTSLACTPCQAEATEVLANVIDNDAIVMYDLYPGSLYLKVQ